MSPGKETGPRVVANGSDMGQDRIRYFLYLEGRWRWRPTKRMRDCGLTIVAMGKGGPGLDADGNPAASVADKRRAIELNSEWDQVRAGGTPRGRLFRPQFAPGSVGDGYYRALDMREAERKARGITWTKEQHSRDDWPRAWKWIGPEFGDCDPTTVQPEHFLRLDERTGELLGLLPRIEREVSVTERHRVVKVWRALWVKMAAMGFCVADADPAKAFRNSAPDPRQAAWQRREVLRRVQLAWRMGYCGLAACIAVAWDSMLSPVDARRLTPAQCTYDGQGVMFVLGRAKTGKAALGTLSPWALAILTAYVKKLGVELAPNAPIFRNRSGAPYSKDTLGDDFRSVRADYDPADKRQLADMRRSGAIEGDAGGAEVTDQANKMANSIDTNKRLRKTYNPVNAASVRRFDEARVKGAKVLGEKAEVETSAPALLQLFGQRK
ncbi:hypothetical protein ACVWXN_002686 [Bradyrhizobium sp. i1.4.4]